MFGGVGDGTIFNITPRGALTTLHSFEYKEGATPTRRSYKWPTVTSTERVRMGEPTAGAQSLELHLMAL